MGLQNSSNSDNATGQEFLLSVCTEAYAIVGGLKPSNRVPPSLNWGDAIVEATRQQILPLVATRLLPERDQGHEFLYSFIHDILMICRLRHRTQIKAATEVQQALWLKGITALVRKGPVYQSVVSGNGVYRDYGDLDFLIQPEKSRLVQETLLNLGFKFGSYDYRTNSLVPLPRSERALYLLNPDHLPPLVRMTDDPFVPAIGIDVAFDLTWQGSGATEEVRGLFASMFNCPVVCSTTGLFTFSHHLHFIDCALHLFREAYFENGIRSGDDVNLKKFLDMALLWSLMTPEDKHRASVGIRCGGISQWVAWAAFHLDSMFDSNISDELALSESRRIEPFTWRSNDGNVHAWKGTMKERIFSIRRKELFYGLN